MPNERLTYGDLSLLLLVDENMENLYELFILG